MPSWFLLDPEPRPDFVDADLVVPTALCQRLVAMHSKPADVVLDPFAGYGTTLIAAQALGRRAVGIELDDARFAYLRTLGLEVIQGDVLQADIPEFDLLLTSPPYWDPDGTAFAGYGPPGESYDHYLDTWRTLLARFAERIRDGGRIILLVPNIRIDGRLHPLAWDLGRLMSESFEMERELIACCTWPPPGAERYGEHLYCLMATMRRS
ncbi:MAG TPA: DNA methyltransferase [Thermoanaerobaculia bacterium]|nr:DNA methyltransferase [Thermoanaerobaculia bacterium]